MSFHCPALHFSAPICTDGAEKSAAFETLASAADSRPASQLARRVTDASLVSGTDAAASTIYNSTVPVQPQERRILNYLVNEYLQTQCFKMSALTFADENDDQDLEGNGMGVKVSMRVIKFTWVCLLDWEDVIGVPKEVMPPPPNVLALYRSWKYGPQEQMVVVASVPQPGAQTNIAKENQVNDTKLDEIAAGASLLLMPPPLDAIPETSTVPPPAQNLNSLQTAPTPSSSTTTATRMPQRVGVTCEVFLPTHSLPCCSQSLLWLECFDQKWICRRRRVAPQQTLHRHRACVSLLQLRVADHQCLRRGLRSHPRISSCACSI